MSRRRAAPTDAEPPSSLIAVCCMSSRRRSGADAKKTSRSRAVGAPQAPDAKEEGVPPQQQQPEAADVGVDASDAVDAQGWTAMMKAAAGNRVEIMEVLHSAGVSVDEANLSGETPLMAAAHAGSRRALAWLLEHGADWRLKPTSGNWSGKTAFDLLGIEQKTIHGIDGADDIKAAAIQVVMAAMSELPKAPEPEPEPEPQLQQSEPALPLERDPHAGDVRAAHFSESTQFIKWYEATVEAEDAMAAAMRVDVKEAALHRAHAEVVLQEMARLRELQAVWESVDRSAELTRSRKEKTMDSVWSAVEDVASELRAGPRWEAAEAAEQAQLARDAAEAEERRALQAIEDGERIAREEAEAAERLARERIAMEQAAVEAERRAAAQAALSESLGELSCLISDYHQAGAEASTSTSRSSGRPGSGHVAAAGGGGGVVNCSGGTGNGGDGGGGLPRSPRGGGGAGSPRAASPTWRSPSPLSRAADERAAAAAALSAAKTAAAAAGRKPGRAKEQTLGRLASSKSPRSMEEAAAATAIAKGGNAATAKTNGKKKKVKTKPKTKASKGKGTAGRPAAPRGARASAR